MDMGLDFELSETLNLLRESIRQFASHEIAPYATSIDQSNEFPNALWQKMGALGLLGITAAEEYGGSNLGYLAHVNSQGRNQLLHRKSWSKVWWTFQSGGKSNFRRSYHRSKKNATCLNSTVANVEVQWQGAKQIPDQMWWAWNEKPKNNPIIIF